LLHFWAARETLGRKRRLKGFRQRRVEVDYFNDYAVSNARAFH